MKVALQTDDRGEARVHRARALRSLVGPTACAVAVLAAAQPAAVAREGARRADQMNETAVTMEGCKERFAGVLGQPAAVRSLVPEAYELLLYPGTDRPLLWVSSLHCERVTVDGASSEATIAGVAAFIESPDGAGCMSTVPVIRELDADALPICNAYLLWYATTSPAHETFLRAGTPDFPAWLSDDLTFNEGDFEPAAAGVPFQFRAGPSAPFVLESDLVIRDRPGAGPLVVSFWHDTTAGTVKLEIVMDQAGFGEASGVVRTRAGTPLADLFGGETAEQAGGVSFFGAPHFPRAVITKKVVGRGAEAQAWGSRSR